jgi:hypothetical protein
MCQGVLPTLPDMVARLRLRTPDAESMAEAERAVVRYAESRRRLCSGTEQRGGGLCVLKAGLGLGVSMRHAQDMLRTWSTAHL